MTARANGDFNLKKPGPLFSSEVQPAAREVTPADRSLCPLGARRLPLHCNEAAGRLGPGWEGRWLAEA